jgi:hypothetical protein
VPTATSPVTIDRERDEGAYYDENVWVVHDLSDVIISAPAPDAAYPTVSSAMGGRTP